MKNILTFMSIVSVSTIAISMLVNLVPHSKVNSSVTTMPVNDNSINYVRKWKFHEGYKFGRGINNHSNFPAIVRLNSKTKYSQDLRKWHKQWCALSTERRKNYTINIETSGRFRCRD